MVWCFTDFTWLTAITLWASFSRGVNLINLTRKIYKSWNYFETPFIRYKYWLLPCRNYPRDRANQILHGFRLWRYCVWWKKKAKITKREGKRMKHWWRYCVTEAPKGQSCKNTIYTLCECTRNDRRRPNTAVLSNTVTSRKRFLFPVSRDFF